MQRADRLFITFDNCPPDIPTLIIARDKYADMIMLKKITGDEALRVYRYLVGITNELSNENKEKRTHGRNKNS